MTGLRVMALRIRGMFAKRRQDAELNDELQAHLEMLAEENMQRGMSAEDARRAAKIELGGVEQIKEAVRDQRGLPLLESLVAHVRFGSRMLRKNPSFTAVVILTLVLGIAATTAIFTVAYATLLAPLPYTHSDRLVNVWSNLQGHRNWVSAGDFTDWKRRSTAFEELNAVATNDFDDRRANAATRSYRTAAIPGFAGT